MDRTERNLDKVELNVKKTDRIVSGMSSTWSSIKNFFSKAPTDDKLKEEQRKQQKKAGTLHEESKA